MKRLLFFGSLILAAVLLWAFFHSRKIESFFPRLGAQVPPPAALQSLLAKTEGALAKNPGDLEALVDKGVVYFQMGPDHYSESLNAFHAAWDSGAFDKRIFYYTGILDENLSLFDDAQKQYERFLNHEPEDREIALRLARLLFRMGKWQDAILQYRKLTDKDSKDATSLTNLGLAYQKRYETESAEKKTRLPDAEIESFRDQGIGYLEKARSLDPNLSKGIYLCLAKLYFAKGEWQKAAESAQLEISKYAPEGDKETLQALAQALEKLEDKPRLLDVYLKLEQIDPQSSSVKRKIKSLQTQLKIK